MEKRGNAFQESWAQEWLRQIQGPVKDSIAIFFF